MPDSFTDDQLAALEAAWYAANAAQQEAEIAFKTAVLTRAPYQPGDIVMFMRRRNEPPVDARVEAVSFNWKTSNGGYSFTYYVNTRNKGGEWSQRAQHTYGADLAPKDA